MTGDRSSQNSRHSRRARGELGWSSCTSPSTITAASPTPWYCPTKKLTTAAAFTRRAVAFYRRYGIRVERVLSDNGSAYRSTVHAIACRRPQLKHLRTRPYRPQTNGKAERLIRTLLSGWTYGAIYRSSSERTAALTAGSGTTTIDADTQPSATNRPSAEPTSSGPTSSGDRSSLWAAFALACRRHAGCRSR
jgi:transposase InsO family protein